MKDIFLINYSVQGIKTLEKKVILSFYKKTITKKLDTENYNIKGIYGINGSGKSAIVASVDILRNLLINPDYLNNPFVQKYLEGLINKKTKELIMIADFIFELDLDIFLFNYNIKLVKDFNDKYVISEECLSVRNALSKIEKMTNVYAVEKGNLIIGNEFENELTKDFIGKTANLLESSSFCELFFRKKLSELMKKNTIDETFVQHLACLYVFGRKIHVYMDKSDDHKNYFLKDTLFALDEKNNKDFWFDHLVSMNGETLNTIDISNNIIPIKYFKQFEKDVSKLFDFIRIFKSELCGIEIDRKENGENYICNLIMRYDGYGIAAEFESTGIKKLIKIYAYIYEMVHGGIVFIDEFDSNLHDVYLCALLEYLMGYGKGQLCFTTHNVGPMDILKQNKKSIDFLSMDHRITSWVKNGHYSPSNLYRGGMIEGSPFNVDSIDFIGAFDSGEDD